MKDRKDKLIFECTNRLLNSISHIKEVKKVLVFDYFHGYLFTDYRDSIISSFVFNIKALVVAIKRDDERNRLLLRSILKEANLIIELSEKLNQNINENDLSLLAKTNAAINVFLSCYIPTYTVKSLDDLIEKCKTEEKVYYRGQLDEYDLAASFFRDLNFKRLTVNEKYLINKYGEMGIIERYKLLFNETKIGLRFLPFAQHSFSYSPLLDVSEDMFVALSFGVSPKGINPNKYETSSAAFYEFNIPHDQIRTLGGTIRIRMMNVKYIKNAIFCDEKMINGKHLFESKYNEAFRCRFTFNFHKSNDRMMAQQGDFFLFYYGFIINGIMMIPFDMLSIKKYVINPQLKKEIYQLIQTNNKYDKYRIENLYNPYDFYSNYLKK